MGREERGYIRLPGSISSCESDRGRGYLDIRGRDDDHDDAGTN